uniref:Receptor L-domain domain-containing protein n=2 Tax=Panagrolaimus superbus TaxID=310955 RepID=A0A914YFS2_9BILA
MDQRSVREIYPYYSYQNFDESENPIDENNLCKIIIGDLQITENTFHSVGGRGALPYSSLWFLNNVEVITGKLKISMGERKYFGLLKNVQHVKALEAEDKNIIDLIQSNLFAQLSPITGEDCACPSPNLSTDKCVFAGHCRRT